jgi:outer membrane protein
LQNQLNTQALSLSPDRRADLDKQIQRKVLELNQTREAATSEMQIEIGEAQGRFQEQLLAVIDDFGREEGFTLILEASLVAYADQSADVTTAIVDRFNQVFKAETGADSGGAE